MSRVFFNRGAMSLSLETPSGFLVQVVLHKRSPEGQQSERLIDFRACVFHCEANGFPLPSWIPFKLVLLPDKLKESNSQSHWHLLKAKEISEL